MIILTGAISTGCVSVPKFTSKKTVETEYKEAEHKIEKKASPEIRAELNPDSYENAEVLETVTGVASYYADKYDGKVTYSGEVYDMNGLSAAHPSYQMGTIIRVTNLSNNRKVVIRVNDKMPLRPDRIIDLSLGTARELDMVPAGITEVKVEVLEWGKGKINK